jgi:phage gpG-like protein
MARFDDDTINVTGLDQLCKALKKKPPVTRVGIIGDKNERSAEEGEKAAPTNSEIGAAHEYGSPKHNLPQRSFLRVPLIDHLQERMEKKGAVGEAEMKEVLKSGTIVPWMKKIGILAEEIIQDAFQTGGFGKWKQSDMTRKKVKMTLVETQQLRDSITSEVKE